MNQPKFNLKTPNEPESLIYLIFRYESRRLKISTGLTVPVKFWNNNKMRVKNNNQFPKHELYNQILEKYSDAAKESYLELLKDEQKATNSKLKERVNSKVNGSPKNTDDKTKTLHSFLDTFLEMKRGDSTIKDITTRNYEKVIRLIKKYEKSKFFLLSDIDKDFHINFRQFLFNTKFQKGDKTKRHYQPNYIARLMKSYRGIMQYAFSEGLIKDQSFSSKELTVSAKETDTVYLNENELESIYTLDLSDNPKLDRARDLFLIGCHTGLRFSDVAQLNMNQVIESNGKFLIKVPTKKTGETVIIPLKSVVLEIIGKYDGFPKNLSNQKLNEYIKEVCKLAEINDKCLDRKYVRGKTIKEYKEKWEMVSSHTARRSFATNAYLNGISPIKIKKITGHKKESTFLKYIRISELENALDLADNDFFD
ncbi:site-specific integrase [Membranihabitans maritimus]|uniref:site-specific integrase n=1 Tax=Membranihabitans maritimus TaxID=2904244 RepID=UPI001F1A0F85|nr:site-specific integrase [Membranihabitans maritimus]